MSLVIRGRLRDALSFVSPMRERARRFKAASALPPPEGAMNGLTEALHPETLALRVESIRREAEDVATFRLVPARSGERLPPFKAGQYLSAVFRRGSLRTTRPFSISSSPDEARDGTYYELTAKLKPEGLCTPWMFEDWIPGAEVSCSGPAGEFCYEPLRDGSRIVCLAGGTGITPFKSILADSLERDDASFVLVHGVARPEALLFAGYFSALAARYPGRLRVVPVCAEAGEGWSGRRGFISDELLREEVPDYREASYFVCGPDAMKAHLERQMADWGLKPRQLRREGSSEVPDPASLPGYPAGALSETTFQLEVRRGAFRAHVAADPRETVLVALERAGLEPPSLCRGGECGWCRSRLVEGELFAPEGSSKLRAADAAYGYFHPCRSYPLSRIVIELPEGPAPGREVAG